MQGVRKLSKNSTCAEALVKETLNFVARILLASWVVMETVTSVLLSITPFAFIVEDFSTATSGTSSLESQVFLPAC